MSQRVRVRHVSNTKHPNTERAEEERHTEEEEEKCCTVFARAFLPQAP